MFILIRINVNICSWINFILRFQSKVFHCFTQSEAFHFIAEVGKEIHDFSRPDAIVGWIYCRTIRQRKVKHQNSYYGKYREKFAPSGDDTVKMVLKWFNLNKFPVMSCPDWRRQWSWRAFCLAYTAPQQTSSRFYFVALDLSWFKTNRFIISTLGASVCRQRSRHRFITSPS